jgi:hypothetical protein
MVDGMTRLPDLPSPDEPEAAFAVIRSSRALLNQLERLSVVHALEQGWTWARIGQALGVSAQAAHKRFGHSRDRWGHRRAAAVGVVGHQAARL